MFDTAKNHEGEPGTCPICSAEVRIDDSLWFGETACPGCGEHLWLIRFNYGLVAFKPSESVKQRGIPNVLSEYLGIDESKIKPDSELDLGIDSLDFVELVMELEGEEAVV